MSLPKAGEGAANYDVFPVTCVVDVLRFSVTAYVGARENACYHAYSEKAAHRARDLPSRQEVPFALFAPVDGEACSNHFFHRGMPCCCNQPICATLCGSLVLRLSTGIIAGFDVGLQAYELASHATSIFALTLPLFIRTSTCSSVAAINNVNCSKSFLHLPLAD